MSLQELNKIYANYTRYGLLDEIAQLRNKIKQLSKLFDMACERLAFLGCPPYRKISEEECDPIDCKDCWKKHLIESLKEAEMKPQVAEVTELDICKGCGTQLNECKPLWEEQKKCCPDCSH